MAGRKIEIVSNFDYRKWKVINLVFVFPIAKTEILAQAEFKLENHKSEATKQNI